MGDAAAQVLNRSDAHLGQSYRQRSPKNTILYQVVQENFSKFVSNVELPDHVAAEFDAFLQCGLLEHGFVKMTCDDCKASLLVPLSCKKRGFCPSCIGKRMSEGAAFFASSVIPRVPVRQWVLSFPMPARFWMAKNPRLMGSLLNIFIRAVNGYYRGAYIKSAQTAGQKIQTGSLTVIQRFGGALNMNIHFHVLFLDGVYTSKRNEDTAPEFHPHHSERTEDVENVLKSIQKRMIRHLIKRGLISKYENDPVPDESNEMTLFETLLGASVLGQIGLGENKGKKVRRVGSFGSREESSFKSGPMGATLAGFSLHAATCVRLDDRDRLETLCKYLLRPPVSEKRISRLHNGDVELKLKSEWSDGTYAVRFTPFELIEKLIAIIPQPRIHGVRFHGILGPAARDRKKVVPVTVEPPIQGDLFEVKSKTRPKPTNWAELLKKTFQIDLTVCMVCGGSVKFQKAVLKKGEILEALSLAGLSPTPE